MSALQEIISGIIIAVVTGTITFFITRYSYRNQTTIDKLEIAYNGFYYPVFQYIFEHPKLTEYGELIALCDILMKEHEKYLSLKTVEIYHLLKKANEKNDKANMIHWYDAFEKNIKQSNNRLRYRIGYFQSEIYDSYLILSMMNQLVFWIVLLVFLINVLITIDTFVSFKGRMNFYIQYMVFIFVVLLTIFIITGGIVGIKNIWDKVKHRRNS